MDDDFVVESNQEAAEGDDICSAQPPPQEEQPVMAAPASNLQPPASNMAAAGRDQADVPAPKGRGKVKPPRSNMGLHPLSMGVNYQFADPYGYWSGHGQQLPMPFQPQVPFAAGPGMSPWLTPPPVPMNMQGGAGPTPRSHGW